MSVQDDLARLQGGSEVWDAPPETPDAPEVDFALDDAGTGIEPTPAEPAARETRAPATTRHDADAIAPPRGGEQDDDGIETAPEEVPDEQPTELDWKSVDDIQKALEADAVPPEARAYVEAAYAQLQPHVASMESAKLGLEQSQKILTELTQRMEAAGQKGSVELGNQLMGTLENVDTMSDGLTKIAWRHFDVMHPEYSKIPKDHPVRAAFVGMLERGDHFKLFPDEETYYDQVERAYELAAFRTKTDLAKFAPNAPKQPAQRAAAPNARPTVAPAAVPRKKTGGALVADGSIAPNPPRRSVDELTDDEVLSANEHLLN